MATTTNYGWTTPDDTALVKDGAAAIRTLGSSVDTTTKALNPSTTLGDIEYRSSTANTNTRVGIGSSGQALTVVAGVPSWAASPTSVLTTTGDTLYASAANTLARLGIGSTGNVLTVAGGVPTWAAPAGGGKVLQVVQAGSTSQTTIASTSYTDTTLEATITPSSTSSKILILAMQQGNLFRAQSPQEGNFQLLRDATSIKTFTPVLRNQGASSINLGLGVVTPLTWLDSPSTTSATTYKVQASVNYTANSGAYEAQYGYSASVITLLEIGA
jgi:hypothetical protein